MPAGSRRAAFEVQAPGRRTAQVLLRTSTAAGKSADGPRFAVTGTGTIRPKIANPDGPGPRHICLVGVAGQVTVLGSGGVPAFRLTGARPETAWTVLPAMVQRSTVATGAPARWVGLVGVVVLFVGSAGLALWLVVTAWSRADWRPGRRTWGLVGLVAVLHGLAWATLTPPFEVPDEWAHEQYVTYVADHAEIPNGRGGGFAAPDQGVAMQLLGANSVPMREAFRPPWQPESGPPIRAAIGAAPSSPVPDGTTSATGQPPLYYALGAAVDAVAPGSFLDRMIQVRLVGVLALGLLALGIVALARRLAPARPTWALTSGLLAGLFPLLGFLAGGVTPDVVMVALAVWTVVAALRLRDDPRLGTGLAVGLLGSALVLVKLTAIALVPAVALLVLLAFARALRAGWPRGASRGLMGLAMGIAGPLLAYVAWTVISDRPIVPGTFVAVARAEGAPGAHGAGPFEFLSLTWQLYLPRLPFMDDLVVGSGPWDIWLRGLVGRYGWLDYELPTGVAAVLSVLWGAVVVAAIVGAARLAGRLRAASRATRVDVSVVALALVLVVAGVLFAIARADYTAYVAGEARFQQARYLLLAAPAVVPVVLLALRALPERWRGPVAVGAVGFTILQLVASLMATVGRYYG